MVPQADSTRRLLLTLLGAPRQFLDGEEVAGLPSAKVQGLLYYLAVTRVTHRRATLATLFWPTASEQNANNSLRNALSSLRKRLPNHLKVDRHTVAVNEHDLWLDVEQFVQLLEEYSDDPIVAVQQRQAAVSLYAGEFLAGFHVDDAPEFERWVLTTREHLHQAMVDALMELAQWYSAQRDDTASLEAISRSLALSPGNEAGHRFKMRVLAQMGQREAAILQFDTCRTYLAEELGVDPSPETAALYAQLLEGHTIEGQSADELSATASVMPTASVQGMGRFRHVDPGDMPGRTHILGRFHQLAELTNSLIDKRCTLVVISGMGGVGKTALATELVHRLAELPIAQTGFTQIVWRSLINTPALGDLVDDWLRTLGQSPSAGLPDRLDAKLGSLFAILDQRRVLLVLDNAESVMAIGNTTSGYRDGIDSYHHFFERMAHGYHQSCLLLTSREAPRSIQRLAIDYAHVDHIRLQGLSPEKGMALLRDRKLAGNQATLRSLVIHYSGNPLALKLVASAVSELYTGDADAFLADGVPVFEDVRDVLDQHFNRLSETARDLLVWLTIVREPVEFEDVGRDFVARPSQRELLESIRVLRRSSLLQDAGSTTAADVEEPGMKLAVHNLVMEYVSDRLLNEFQAELGGDRVDYIHRYALCTARAPEYIQAAQRRLFVAPLAQWLTRHHGVTGARDRLRRLLDYARREPALAEGYTGANVIHLMLQLSPDLQGEDFSGLSLRQVDLRSASLVDVDLRNADLASTRFADSFGIVSSVAISPDGHFIAAGAGRTVIIWQFQTLQPHMIFEEHPHSIPEVTFTPDGRHLASASIDGTIIIWNVATGTLVKRFKMAHGDVISIAFDHDGETLVAGGYAGRIELWDWQLGKPSGFLAIDEPILRLAFAPTGELLAAIGYDGEIQAWDVPARRRIDAVHNERKTHDTYAAIAVGHATMWANQGDVINGWDRRTKKLICALNGHETWVTGLALSPNETHIASADANGAITIWNVRSGRPQKFLEGHRGSVRGLAYSPDGRFLISGGYDETVRIWDVQTGLEEKRFQGHLRWIHQLAVSPNGQLVAGVTLVGKIYLWESHDLNRERIMDAHKTAVRALAFSADSRQLATAGDDGIVIVWDVHSGKARHLFQAHQRYARRVVFDHTGRYLASSGYDHTINVWDIDSGRLHQTVSQTSINTMNGMAFHPHRSLLAYGDTSDRLLVWSIEMGQVVATLKMERSPKVVAFSPDGRFLACGCFDGAVVIWKIALEKAGISLVEQRMIHSSDQGVWQLRFSPDGSLLAWTSERREIYVVSVTDDKTQYSIAGSHLAECFTFSTDGTRLITDGPGSDLFIHDAFTGDVVNILSGHGSNLTSIVAHRNANIVASSDSGGDVKLWDVHAATEVANVSLSSPYYGMNIQGATGLTVAQRRALIALGAKE